MRDIIYEIQYRHHVQRGHCLLDEKESEKSIFYLTHYTYQYLPILKSDHINIFKPLSKPLLNHFQLLLNIYRPIDIRSGSIDV